MFKESSRTFEWRVRNRSRIQKALCPEHLTSATSLNSLTTLIIVGPA